MQHLTNRVKTFLDNQALIPHDDPVILWAKASVSLACAANLNLQVLAANAQVTNDEEYGDGFAYSVDMTFGVQNDAEIYYSLRRASPDETATIWCDASSYPAETDTVIEFIEWISRCSTDLSTE